jgi:hypothetical protein
LVGSFQENTFGWHPDHVMPLSEGTSLDVGLVIYVEEYLADCTVEAPDYEVIPLSRVEYGSGRHGGAFSVRPQEQGVLFGWDLYGITAPVLAPVIDSVFRSCFPADCKLFSSIWRKKK